MKFNLGVKAWPVVRSSSAWVDGELVVTQEDGLVVRGSLQPVNPREAALMPDAYRTRARWKLYAQADGPELRVAGSRESDGLGDFVLVHGERCLVVAFDDWGTGNVGSRLRSVSHVLYILAAPAGGP